MLTDTVSSPILNQHKSSTNCILDYTVLTIDTEIPGVINGRKRASVIYHDIRVYETRIMELNHVFQGKMISFVRNVT